MPSAPSHQVQTRNSLLQQLFEVSQVIAQHSGLDANFLPIVGSLVAALILTTLFINLLVWLRYMVITGLITICIGTGVRWNRKEARKSVLDDGCEKISQNEHNLEIEDVD